MIMELDDILANLDAGLCACGRDVFIISTGQCQRCYHREYARTRRAPRTRMPSNLGRYPSMPSTSPCSYLNAHKRVHYWRGKASDHTCVDCGATAEEWSYRGGSTREQRGYVTRHDRAKPKLVSWSPHVMDYDARCVPCHRAHDRSLLREEPTIPLVAMNILCSTEEAHT